MTPPSLPPTVAGDGTAADSPPASSGHSVFGRCLYAVLWVLSRTLGVALFGVRYRFAEPLPPHGGLIILSSHQSHLDPLLLGLAAERRLSSLARSSLYRFKPFGIAITALGAVPIDRNASTVAAMKTVIRRLEAGAAVIILTASTRDFCRFVSFLRAQWPRQSAWMLVAAVSRATGVPVIFGVLTTDTLQQALERAGIKSNLGWSYGLQALEMGSLMAALPS